MIPEPRRTSHLLVVGLMLAAAACGPRLPPAAVHFTGELAVWLGPKGGSHLDHPRLLTRTLERMGMDPPPGLVAPGAS